jgi:hypothetical protein
MFVNTYGVEFDAVVKTMQLYIDGCKQGNSQVMRPAFHEHAGFFGYAGPELAIGTAFLFDWVDKNGPSPHIRPRFVSVDILESIAAVHLEVDGWSGSLAGPAVCMSDIFTLLKTPDGWRIIQKAFHWHS